jgi:S-ribosylhomocysteine lyase
LFVLQKEKTNVESFDLDHTKVIAPYVRLAGVKTGKNGDEVYKYDIRFKQPNKEHMEMPALHSLEHLSADIIRNYSDHIVDFSPMGCQTGFYVSLINHNDYEELLNILEKTFTDVTKATAVPACNEVQCGWAASHSLEGAKALAKEFLAKRDEWHIVFAE